MQPDETPRQPQSIQPAPPIRWLGATSRACQIGSGQLPPEGAVWVVPSRDALTLRVVYGTLFAGRQGIVVAGECSAAEHRANADRLQAGLDVLMPAELGNEQAQRDLLRAIELARAAARSVLPVAVSASALVGFAGQAIPLPWAQVVVIVDAPFRVPDHPETIPDAWPTAIRYMLERAGGQAREALATWRHSGQRPGETGQPAGR